jgi:hypothetical protein
LIKHRHLLPAKLGLIICNIEVITPPQQSATDKALPV